MSGTSQAWRKIRLDYEGPRAIGARAYSGPVLERELSMGRWFVIKLIVTEQNALFQALGGNKQALEEAASVSDLTCLGTVSWVCSQIQPMDAYYERS